MNPVEEQLPPPPQHPQPHRISTSCDRHPNEQFTGFCPSCLFERLSVLDQSAASSSTTAVTAGRKSASSALRSIFRGSSAVNGNAAGERPTFRTRPGSFLPELRRTKSFSGGKNDGGFGFTGIFEPQRKSCDVRGRNTLFSLFSQDDGKRTAAASSSKDAPSSSSSRLGPGAGADQLEGKFKSSRSIVLELHEEDEREQEVFYEEGEEVGGGEEEGEACCEIEEIEEPISNNSNPKLSTEEQLGDILEAEKIEFKPMKDHMDLDSHSKKAGGKDLKELAGSFWSAASVFSKKLKSWTKKNNKLKKHSGGRTVQVNKKSNAGRSCRETQSEIADYGNGRRSCDIDPRFSLDAGRMSLDYGRISLDAGRMSLDAGRMSLDDPRYSFDEPRASWDGYLIGGGRTTNFPRMPSMLSVVEGSPAPSAVHPPHQPSAMVMRKDSQIPLEEPRKSINDEEFVPGGAAQTKDYYSDSSSRRRKSLDRSNSIRKTAASVVAEMDDMTPAISNAKVTPTAVEYIHGGSGKGIAGVDRDLRDSIPNSLRDDRSESFDFGFRDSASVIGGNGDRKGAKKSKSWKSWNIWGLIVRRGTNKDEDDDRYSRANGVERSFSESWQELGRDGYGGDPRVAFNRNGFRSNSSVSWRNSYSNGGSIGGSLRKSNVEPNGHSKKKSNEFVLERNRSARYSPNDVDNGLLRFYLTPLRGSRRGAKAKPKPAAYSHTIARSMLRMY
ncbi:hypothetical protein V2J09_010516 [Rumex salicifolius]